MTFIPAFTTNARTSDLLSLNFHGWVVTFQDSHRTVFTFHSWLDLLGVVLAVWISILKVSQITLKLLTQGYRYYKLRKTFAKFFRSYSELLSKLGDISFQEYLSIGISHPVFYGDLVYKLRRVKDTPNFILSSSKIVQRLWRHYNPVIIERTKGLCFALLQPCTDLSWSIALWLTRRWRLYDGPCPNLLRRLGPNLCPLWLLVGTPSAIRPELASSRAEHNRPYSDVAKYIFDIYLSKVITDRFSILNKIQTKKDIRLYILTLVLVDIKFTFGAKVWIQF